MLCQTRHKRWWRPQMQFYVFASETMSNNGMLLLDIAHAHKHWYFFSFQNYLSLMIFHGYSKICYNVLMCMISDHIFNLILLFFNSHLFQLSFFRQFFRSVRKADYLTMRHGFIAVSIFKYNILQYPVPFGIMYNPLSILSYRYIYHLGLSLTSKNILKGH